MSEVPDLTALYLEYRQRIFDFIRRRVQTSGTSNEIAEDLTQDVFRKACEALGRGVEVEYPGGWLHRIARNAIIDYYRARDCRPSAVAWDDIWYEADNDIAPDDYAISAVGCDAIWGAVGRLTEGQARAVALLVEGYRSEDLGDAMGMSKDGAKQLLLRGRHRLIELFETKGYAPWP